MSYRQTAGEETGARSRGKLRLPRRVVGGILVAGVAALVAAGCGDDGGGAADGTIELGAVVPSSGPFAEWGQGNTVALKMLQKEINADGGVKGEEVRIQIHDDAADPAQAGNLVRKLADEGALAVAGPLTSSAAEVAFPVANQLEIASVSQASSKPGVAEDNRPWAFRNTIDEAILADATVTEWQEMFDVQSAAIIYDSKDAVSTAIGTAIYPEVLEAHDIEPLNGDDPASFQTGDVDVSAQITQLKSLNPDGVVIGADYSQAVTVIREMEKQGLTVPVTGGTPLISSAILKASTEIPIVAPATYYVGIEDERAREFTDKLRERLRAAGHRNLEPTMYDANIYETMRMVLEAIRKNSLSGDLEEDRTMIRDYLDELEGFEGLVGPISFNENGDAEKSFYVVLAEEGEWVPLVVCESSAPEQCEKATGSGS